MNDLLHLRLELTSTLALANKYWLRVINKALDGYGVSASGTVPLILIGRCGGGIHQISLADQLGIAGPSLVRVLDKLCAAGLVIREEDAADRRAKTLWLTAAGRRLVRKLEARLTELRNETLGQLSRQELKAALRVYRILAGAGAKAEAEAR